MDIDQGRIQGLMPHKVLDRQEICAAFIQVGSESMAEGMAGKPVLPAKGILMSPHMAHDVKGINGTGRICLFWEKPAAGTSVFKPVSREDIQRFRGKDGIPVRTVLGVGDMDPHIFAFNITVTEVTDFPNPEPGRIHEGDHSFGFQVRKRRDKKF